MDCTQDNAKSLCEKYGVEGYPTIKYFSKDTADLGEKYEGEREYNKLKKFVKQMSKPPCVVSTLENCNKKEKTYITQMESMDPDTMKKTRDDFQTQIEAATNKHKELADLFEKQKDEAMATMKSQEEAKKTMEAASKSMKYKINILEQKLSKPAEKSEL